MQYPPYIRVNHNSRHDDVVAIDPDIRTFMITYNTNDFYTEWGEGDMKRVFSLCLQLDKLISRAYGPEMKNKHGEKGRRKRKSIRIAIERLPSQIQNKIGEVNKKLSTWLCSTYNVILIPKFNAKAMSARKGRKIHIKTERGMFWWSHHRFRQRLIAKSELFSGCKVIEYDESYTCKTCRYWGVINDKLGGSKVIKCKQENGQQKSIGSDCNIHAARSILLCYLTRNNIVIRVRYLEAADVTNDY